MTLRALLLEELVRSIVPSAICFSKQKESNNATQITSVVTAATARFFLSKISERALTT